MKYIASISFENMPTMVYEGSYERLKDIGESAISIIRHTHPSLAIALQLAPVTVEDTVDGVEIVHNYSWPTSLPTNLGVEECLGYVIESGFDLDNIMNAIGSDKELNRISEDIYLVLRLLALNLQFPTQNLTEEERHKLLEITGEKSYGSKEKSYGSKLFNNMDCINYDLVSAIISEVFNAQGADVAKLTNRFLKYIKICESIGMNYGNSISVLVNRSGKDSFASRVTSYYYPWEIYNAIIDQDATLRDISLEIKRMFDECLGFRPNKVELKRLLKLIEGPELTEKTKENIGAFWKQAKERGLNKIRFIPTYYNDRAEINIHQREVFLQAEVADSEPAVKDSKAMRLKIRIPMRCGLIDIFQVYNRMSLLHEKCEYGW